MSSLESPNLPDNQNSPPVTVPNKQNTIELHFIILDESGLLKRLADELRFASSQARIAWCSFKADPIAFLTREAFEFSRKIRTCATPKMFASSVAAIVVVSSVALIVLLGSGLTPAPHLASHEEPLSPFDVVMLNLPTPSESPSANASIGYQGRGRVGFNSGKGEGSNTKTAKSRGGGGGGGKDKSKAPQGAIPQPSEIQARITNLPPSRAQALPVAGIDIDPVLWKALPFPLYGDPRSRSSLVSSGPGTGGGMGDGRGLGIGEGEGPGVGRGKDGNTGGDRRAIGSGGVGGGNDDSNSERRIFPVREVDQRARLLQKPEPPYTEEARRNGITGTVILRAVFSASGEVINIQAMKTLPLGLTEKAITAARQIRFVPAMKGGRRVSVHMQLEYNFNLY